MALPNEIHPFQLLGNDANQFKVANSLRFRQSNSAYLSRTPAVSSGTTLWTYSVWIKRGLLGASGNAQYIIGGNSSTSGSLRYEQTFCFDNSDCFTGYAFTNNSGYAWQRVSNQKFRDPSAWYHIVIQFDSTNATTANRLIVYINNQQLTWATSSDSGVGGDWTTSSFLNINNTVVNAINGGFQNGANGGIPVYYGDAYMAECNMVSGSKVDPTAFGQYNSLTNQWVPKKYTGTYGTNGFYLPFNTPVTSTYAGSFNGSNQYLQATLPATLSGAFTIEYFFNRGSSGNQFMFTLGDSANATGIEIYIGSTGTVLNALWGGSSKITATGSTSVIPVSSWNHIALTRDASNNVRLFLNGVQVGSTVANTNAIDTALRIGVEYFSGSISGYMNGSISNFRVINGTCLYTSNYNVPAAALTAVSGTSVLTLQSATVIDNSGNSLSITNNGTVTTSAATPWTNYIAGQDSSSLGNMWTSSGVSYTSGVTYDSMIDSPTSYNDGGNNRGNYCTMNLLDNGGQTWTISEGNLRLYQGNFGSYTYVAKGSVAVNTGKWYFETYINAVGTGNDGGVGIMDTTWICASTSYSVSPTVWYYRNNGYIYQGTNGSATNTALQTPGTTATTGDLIGVAFDVDAKTISFYKNGTIIGTSQSFTLTTGNYVVPAHRGYYYSDWSFNFGQRPFAYTPPTGFKALNTYNLPNPSLPLV